MLRVSPYINLQGRAREAMAFYQKALGGELHVYPDDPAERVTHARLEADGMLIVATDGHPKFPPTVGDNLALALSGTDKERITATFNALAGGGGKIKAPLHEQPSGAMVGYLLDQFGINWVVTIELA